FSDNVVCVDLSIYNAARIWKLYGTWACKGDSTPERPHRVAQLLQVPELLTPEPRSLLEQLAALAPEKPTIERQQYSNSQGSFNLDSWLATHNLDVSGPSSWKGGRIWLFPVCPWNVDHTNRAAYILQFANGAIAA